MFVVGTWVGIYAIIPASHYLLNSKFNDSFYEAVAGKGLFFGLNLCLYTYISHDPFVVIAVKYILIPLPVGIPVGWALLFTFLITQLFVVSSYYLVYCCLTKRPKVSERDAAQM